MFSAPIILLTSLDSCRFDTPDILKCPARASRNLAELKGLAVSIPNQGILISTLGLQEAKSSSEIENIVTTHDELFKDDVLPESSFNPAAKEVLRYRKALHLGYRKIRKTRLITGQPPDRHSIGTGTEQRRSAQASGYRIEKQSERYGLYPAAKSR